MQTLLVLSLLLCVSLSLAQKPQLKGSPEMMQPMMYENENSEMLNRVSGQLLSALAAIESMQEGPQLKVAEKRRNKFEFIRFGRK